MTSERITGIDVERVTAWLADRTCITAPLRFDLVAHGRSNLTFVVSDADGRRWVLRRPPMGHMLASAHDMAREHRIISALAGTAVPVPGVIGMGTDDAVTGASFYVMEHIEGHILKQLGDMAPFDPVACQTMSTSLVDTLVALHEIDPDAVGLGELGQKEAYLARQLRRWKRQIDDGSDRPLPLFHELHSRLEQRMPTQQGAGIAHGDYRLDNCMIGGDFGVAAVLDWELCTLGDVLADLGGMLMWWGDPTGGTRAMADAPTLADGMLTPDEVISRYGAASSRDLSDLPYYVAFQFWRLAAISEGVRIRFVAGAMGDKDIGDEMAGFETRIDLLLGESHRLLG